MKCCLCGKDIKADSIGWDMGHNPAPVCTIENARCCDECNARIVVPYRLINKDAIDRIENNLLDKGWT